MGRYVLAAAAEADIRDIIAYIRLRNPGAAKRVKAQLREAMRKLADFPGLGHVRDDVAGESLRFWSVYDYLIIYHHGSKPLGIARVVHGARDIERLFGKS